MLVSLSSVQKHSTQRFSGDFGWNSRYRMGRQIVLGCSQNRNAVASGPGNPELHFDADPTLPRFGSDCIQVGKRLIWWGYVRYQTPEHLFVPNCPRGLERWVQRLLC